MLDLQLLSSADTSMQLINDIVGRKDLETGSDLSSCTTQIEVVDFVFEKRRIKLVDTPGFDNVSLSSTKVFQMIAKYLQERLDHYC